MSNENKKMKEQEMSETGQGVISSTSQKSSPRDNTPRGPKALPVYPRNKIGRNKPCPCGSGLKFKKCCLNKYKG